MNTPHKPYHIKVITYLLFSFVNKQVPLNISISPYLNPTTSLFMHLPKHVPYSGISLFCPLIRLATNPSFSHTFGCFPLTDERFTQATATFKATNPNFLKLLSLSRVWTLFFVSLAANGSSLFFFISFLFFFFLINPTTKTV